MKRNGRRVTHVRITQKGENLEWTLYSQSARGTRYPVDQFTTKRSKTAVIDAAPILDKQDKK